MTRFNIVPPATLVSKIGDAKVSDVGVCFRSIRQLNRARPRSGTSV